MVRFNSEDFRSEEDDSEAKKYAEHITSRAAAAIKHRDRLEEELKERMKQFVCDMSLDGSEAEERAIGAAYACAAVAARNICYAVDSEIDLSQGSACALLEAVSLKFANAIVSGYVDAMRQASVLKRAEILRENFENEEE